MTTSEADKQYAMVIHLSQFAGYIIPAVGWVLPLLLWLVRRDSSPYIDTHGKIVMNWILSCIIYTLLGSMLIFLLIGIPLLIALGLCSIIFTIIGAVRASDGIVWAYPLSLPLL